MPQKNGLSVYPHTFPIRMAILNGIAIVHQGPHFDSGGSLTLSLKIIRMGSALGNGPVST